MMPGRRHVIDTLTRGSVLMHGQRRFEQRGVGIGRIGGTRCVALVHTAGEAPQVGGIACNAHAEVIPSRATVTGTCDAPARRPRDRYLGAAGYQDLECAVLVVGVVRY